MTDRILDFSNGPVKLSVRLEQLVIERPDLETVTVPLGDIAAVCAAHPHVRYSQAVLAGLAAAGAVFVVCDRRQMPTAMLLPLEGHCVQAERFRQQTALALPTRKRLWRQLVQAKIRAQGRTLQALHGEDAGLRQMAERVKLGDPDNLEAQASQRYWPLLFDDPGFRRKRDADDQNRSLNYGYGVLRALVARALVAAGLHPTFGLHHSNRYNAFALADDLMEPYRPLVDQAVASSVLEWGSKNLDQAGKADVLDGLLGRFSFQNESRTLFDWLSRLTSCLVAVCSGDRRDLIVPELQPAQEAPPKKSLGRVRDSAKEKAG